MRADRLHAAARARARRRAHRRGRHGAACAMRDGAASSASTTARSCPGCAGAHGRLRRRRRAGRAVAARRRSPMHGEDLTHRRRVQRRRGRARSPFVLTWHPSHLPPPQPGRRRPAALDATERWWREWSRALHVRGARGRDAVAALADHAQGADLRARPAASSPRRPRRCPRSSAACATGTTATAGCATRRSRSMRCCRRGYLERGARPGATGCCGPWPASPDGVQIMYGVAGERRLTESSSTGCRATRARAPVRIGNARRRAVPARRVRRGDGRAAPGHARPGWRTTNAAWAPAGEPCWTSSSGNWREPDEGIWEVRGARRTSPTRR